MFISHYEELNYGLISFIQKMKKSEEKLFKTEKILVNPVQYISCNIIN